jgi:ornithine decarboxylase
VRSELTAFTVFGPTCDPVDRLPRTLELPVDLRTGDYLELGLVGAYGSATATMFNGFDSQRYINVREG